MPTAIGWRPADPTRGGFDEVDDENPLPVYVPPGQPPLVVQGRLVFIGPVIVPGIAAADALDANDQMGTVFSIAVPLAGAIVKAVYHDLDDEGIGKELWIFRNDPTAGVAASDAAFSLADGQNVNVVDVLTFSTFKDAANNQVSVSTDVPCWYVAPAGRLWLAVKTVGADNIAADAMPSLSFVIERYDLG